MAPSALRVLDINEKPLMDFLFDNEKDGELWLAEQEAKEYMKTDPRAYWLCYKFIDLPQIFPQESAQ